MIAVRDKFDLDGKKKIVKDYIASLMKLEDSETEYMKRFVAKEYRPELLFDDDSVLERLINHPMALWKCK